MGIEKITCGDLGSERCPCFLAKTGDCLYCTRLQRDKKNTKSESKCDCNWQGVCVYNEFHQDRERVYSSADTKIYKIIGERTYSEGLKVITLKVDKSLAIKALRVGSYVFARPASANRFFELPISILKSDPDRNTISLALNRCGPKSSFLFDEKDSVVIRGLYGNGVIGVRTLERALMGVEDTHRYINIFARGVAVAPIVNICSIISKHGNYMLYLDDEALGRDFVSEQLGSLDINKVRFVRFKDDIGPLLQLAEGSRFSINVILASPYYIDRFSQSCSNMVYSNSANLCCGEGLCGACTYTTEAGKTIRPCKEG